MRASTSVAWPADGGADAGIDFGKRDRNFGGQPEMMVKRDRNSAPALTRCALFRFDLARLAEPVNDARITLTLSSQGEQSARWKYDFRLYAVGTNDVAGREILANAGLPNVHVEETMLGAASKVVELAG